MFLGAHESISGGIYKAFERGAADGCECIQVFVKNSNRWVAKPLSDKDIKKYFELNDKYSLPVCCHSSYLINMASIKPDIKEKSYLSMVDELKRCDQLNIKYYVIHPGSHLGAGEDEGLKLVAQMIDKAYDENGFEASILLEITAGQGTNLGYKLEHFEKIFDMSKYSHKLNICLDSCHMYSAGFDIVNQYDKVFDELFAKFGDKIKVFHLNDSKKDFSSKLDRHELLGKGTIGIDFFKRVVNDRRFENVLGILETPVKEGETYKGEIEILKSLRGDI
jgi:deoxyribonuclease-4